MYRKMQEAANKIIAKLQSGHTVEGYYIKYSFLVSSLGSICPKDEVSQRETFFYPKGDSNELEHFTKEEQEQLLAKFIEAGYTIQLGV